MHLSSRGAGFYIYSIVWRHLFVDGVEYDFATPITGILTIKAAWTLNQYTITFDTDGGSAIDPITLDFGATVTAPAAPTKEGHTFAGWYLEDAPYNLETPVTADITLVAKWEAAA